METEAMYGSRDVAYMAPRIVDRTSCRRCRGSIRQSMLAGAIRYGIVSRPDSTGSVYGRTLKEIKDTLLRGSVRRLYNMVKEMIRHG